MICLEEWEVKLEVIFKHGRSSVLKLACICFGRLYQSLKAFIHKINYTPIACSLCSSFYTITIQLLYMDYLISVSEILSKDVLLLFLFLR